MNGDEARDLRRQAGLSQAEFASVIGLSRETVGRMERGSEDIDRRTELAMRYVAEKGPLERRTLRKLHQDVADILDEAAVRGRVSVDSTRRLRATSGEWASAGGSAAGAALLLTAQGTIGMLNVSGDNDPLRSNTFGELRQLKLAWRSVADDLPSL
jgi:transcriptional regulator with XRE-family HTH domain